MSVLVLQPGLLTTVQDLGRFGYQKFGLPESGAMDPFAAALANILVGNDRSCAILECFFFGPSLQFQGDTVFAVTGGDLGPQLDRQPVPSYLPIQARAGQVLSFSGPTEGCRCYLALQGGIDVPPVMGSRSTYLRAGLGGFQGRKLEKGDLLPLGAAVCAPLDCQNWRIRPSSRCEPVWELHVVPGPQAEQFSPEDIRVFFSQPYSVTDKLDRMGCRLSGPVLGQGGCHDIISDAVIYGSVQVPASGQPIIMLADHQTVGGYPKIATVVSSDFSILAQLKPGNQVRFTAISLEDARQTALCRERFLEHLLSCREKQMCSAF